jgi:hypothetical protein
VWNDETPDMSAPSPKSADQLAELLSSVIVLLLLAFGMGVCVGVLFERLRP